MPISNVSTQLPNDWAIQSQEIERRRKLAEAMQSQSMEPLQTNQMAGGYVVPISPTQGLAKMLQGYAGQKGQDRATEQQKALAAAMRGERQSTIEQAMAAMQGTPGTPGREAQVLPDDVAGPAAPAMAGTPAVAGDTAKGYGILAASQDPGLSQIGITKTLEDAQRQAMMRSFGLTGGEAQAGAGSQGGAPGAKNDMVGGIPRNIAMSLLLTDPSGKTLAAEQAKAAHAASQPMNVRPGGTVYIPGQGAQFTAPNGSMQTTWQGNQPQVSTVPGALPAMGAQAQATAAGTQAGQAPYQLDTVQTPGAPSLMTRQQQIEAATGQPMPVPGQPMPQQAPQMAQPQAVTPVGPPQQAAPIPVSQPGRLPTNALVSPPGDATLQQNLAAIDAEMNRPGQTSANKETLRRERESVLRQSGARPPGLALQDQSQSAEQKALGTERGQLEAAKPQAAIQARTVLAAVDRLNNVASELENHPGLKDITGKVDQYSVLDVMPQTRAARGLQNTLVKQAAVNTLQTMRDASKTGGAVGAVTEKEWPILEQQLAALDGAQSPADYKVALKNLQNQMKGAMGRIKAAFSETYGGELQYESIPYETQGRTTGAIRRPGGPAATVAERRQEPRASGGRTVVDY